MSPFFYLSGKRIVKRRGPPTEKRKSDCNHYTEQIDCDKLKGLTLTPTDLSKHFLSPPLQ